MNETRRSGWIQIVGTAVLTCLLTVVAGVAVWYFTRQDAALRYTVVKTEPFFGASAATLIYKVEVTDPGNKEVELFTCDIAFPGAKIQDKRVSVPKGLTYTEKTTDSTYSLATSIFNSADRLEMSFLVVSGGVTPTEPDISIRGKGVTGTTKDGDTPFSVIRISSYVPLVAGLLAGLSTLILRIVSRRANGIAGALVPSAHLASSNNILAASYFVHGLVEDGKEILNRRYDVKYWAESDRMAAEEALSGDSDRRPAETKAQVLQYLLEYDNEIGPTSSAIIQYNIARLRLAADDEDGALKWLKTSLSSNQDIVIKRFATHREMQTFVLKHVHELDPKLAELVRLNAATAVKS